MNNRGAGLIEIAFNIFHLFWPLFFFYTAFLANVRMSE